MCAYLAWQVGLFVSGQADDDSFTSTTGDALGLNLICWLFIGCAFIVPVLQMAVLTSILRRPPSTDSLAAAPDPDLKPRVAKVGWIDGTALAACTNGRDSTAALAWSV